MEISLDQSNNKLNLRSNSNKIYYSYALSIILIFLFLFPYFYREQKLLPANYLINQYLQKGWYIKSNHKNGKLLIFIIERNLFMKLYYGDVNILNSNQNKYLN